MAALDTQPVALADDAKALLTVWNDRRKNALSERRKFEGTWLMCKSFVAGRQWVGINPRTGRVIMDKRFEHREMHTVNVVAQYLQTMLGKLFVEDLRPDLVFTRDDVESTSIAEHTQKIGKFLWDTELDADRRLLSVLNKTLSYGTAALRCAFDPSQGGIIADVPVGPDGKPIVDQALAYQYVTEAQQRGEVVDFTPLREGKIVWEALGPTSLLPPPGIEDETMFPWLIIDRAMPIEWARMRWPDVADRIQSSDVSTLDSLDNRDLGTTLDGQHGETGRLKEHVLISTGYEMPTKEYPEGRVVYWTQQTPLEVQPKLPYKLKGNPHHGVTFFHYHKVPDRFWGIGVVEPLIGPQRQKNRARSQMIEMKDRNLGRVYARKGTITAANKPVGKIMELIEIPLHADFPQETTGTPVGPWIENEARMNDEDMDQVAGLREVSQGTAPAGVSAYSAMALLAEQDERRVGPVLKTVRLGIGDAMLLSLYLVRQYWLDGKQIAIAGKDGMIELFNFKRAQLPMEFYIDVSRNAPLPTSPALESQKIFDLFNAATSAGQPLPVDWLKSSLDAGKSLPLPEREEQVQMGKAEQENLMLMQGIPVIPAYYDDDFIHIQVHRHQQMEIAGVPGSEKQAMMIEQHIQQHAQNEAMKKPSGASSGSLPSGQGQRGAEAQNGPSVDQGAAAQTAAAGGQPQVARGVGAAPRTTT